MNNDAETQERCLRRLQAMLDAVRVGLHLWCEKGGAGYWLDKQLDKHDPTE